ncbi:MAG: FHA domain-containing protein [Pyrinomonadaceae bacterium]|nr:FHA domain-containing protein [Pyrinomonadaceae bacterium]
MLEVVLTYPTEYGSEEIVIDKDKTSFGRGNDAEYRFEDNGLSRLHASIFREGDDVWIVDEYSSNGTFVNGEEVSYSGTPLRDGDLIKIGNHTKLKVRVNDRPVEKKASVQAQSTPATAASTVSSEEQASVLIPLAVTAFALFIVVGSLGFIGYMVYAGGEKQTVQNSRETEYIPVDDLIESNSDGVPDTNQTPENPTVPNPIPETTGTDPGPPTSPPETNTELTDSPTSSGQKINANLPTGKKYLQMTDDERNRYITVKAMKVARMIGNRTTTTIPPLAVARIRGFADAYAKRINVPRKGGCKFFDNLQATYERANKNAPFIVKAFNQQGIDPQIGLYLAMIESEHCVCLQSPTGPLGMFQFTTATGRNYGLNTRRSATPANPDERCEPRPAATAAAKYMKYLTGRYGTGPSSVPLAIGSYNSGEGGLSKNLRIALESNNGLPRDFWTMIAYGDKLSKQFQSENFKYVPKFFAAAIIGENPRDFGMTLQPLSMSGG